MDRSSVLHVCTVIKIVKKGCKNTLKHGGNHFMQV